MRSRPISDAAARKSDFERSEAEQGKDRRAAGRRYGPSTLSTGKEIPIFISDYVLVTYGTGAIMAVPAHDDARLGVCQEISAARSSKSLRAADVRRGGLHRQGRHRHYGQLRLPERPDGQQAMPPEMICVAGGAGHWPGKGQLTSCATGFSPASAIGASRSRWSSAKSAAGCRCPGRGAAAGPARGRNPTSRRTTARVPAVQDDGLGQYHLPLLRRPGQARDGHHAPVGRLFAGISCGIWIRITTRPWPATEALEYWSPVDWYNGGMEHTTLHLLYSPFLAQIPLRHRRRPNEGALSEAYLPRYDPGRERRKDVQIPRQRRQPGRHRRSVRRGHDAPV